MNNDKDLKDVNIDIIFYFLLLIASSISFYIVNEKKRKILNTTNVSDETLNKLYVFNRRLIIIINIYFLINVYNTYQEVIKSPHSEEKEYLIQCLLIAVFLGFISSLFYIPIKDSNFILKR